MTLAEYETDFQNKMLKEVQVFQDCLQAISKVPGSEQFIYEICTEVETPFLSVGGDIFGGIADVGLKAQLEGL